MRRIRTTFRRIRWLISCIRSNMAGTFVGIIVLGRIVAEELLASRQPRQLAKAEQPARTHRIPR